MGQSHEKLVRSLLCIAYMNYFTHSTLRRDHDALLSQIKLFLVDEVSETRFALARVLEQALYPDPYFE